MTASAHDLSPELSVAPALEQDVRYGQLQVMADDLLREDLVAAQSGEAVRGRWRELRARTEALLTTIGDVRLHLLRYRAILATDGLLPAGALLESWGDAIARHPLDGMPAEQREVVAATLVHLFTESQVREWQAAALHIDGGPTIRSVFESADVRRREEGGRGKSNAGDQTRLAVTQWLQATPGVLDRVHAIRTTLAAIAAWRAAHPPMVALLRRERATSWLARLQDALIVLGAVGDPEPALGVLGGDTATPAPASTPSAGGGAATTGGTAIPLDLERMRRVDVAGLMQVCVRWFAQNEPGSPVPYFLNRAIVLMNADFHEIVRHLLPEALPHFQMLTGATPGDRG